MFDKILKNKLFVILGLFCLGVISFVAIYIGNNKHGQILLDDNNLESISMVEDKESINKFVVEIKGAVLNPGVYTVNQDSRIIDVINLAGGLLENSNTKYINLSKKVTDEMSIVIYTNEEIENNKENNIVVIEEPCVCPTIPNDGGLNEVVDKSLISINNATYDELISIPGIGSSKANAIIQYRTNNKFTSIEDILNVKGIGQSLFESIKEYITI